MIRHPIFLICILFLSLAIFASTGKTPNYGWMGVYEISNIGVFDGGIPVFRPWIIIEKLEYSLTGRCWLSENLSYALFSAWAIYSILDSCLGRSVSLAFYLIFPPLCAVIFFAAWGGPLYDIIFALSTIKCIDYMSRQALRLKVIDIFYASVWLSVLDLSRPFAIFYFFAFGLLWAFKIGKRSIALLVVAVVIVSPFHYFQYKKHGSLILSTYSGMNLSEVFQFSQRNCNREFNITQIGTVEFSECANVAKNQILSELRGEPKKILTAFTMDRVKRLLFPNPYWHGTGVTDRNPNVVMIYYILVSVIYISFISMTRPCLGSLLCLGVFLFNCVIILVSHGMTELPRLVMPNMVILSYATVRWLRSRTIFSLPHF